MESGSDCFQECQDGILAQRDKSGRLPNAHTRVEGNGFKQQV